MNVKTVRVSFTDNLIGMRRHVDVDIPESARNIKATVIEMAVPTEKKQETIVRVEFEPGGKQYCYECPEAFTDPTGRSPIGFKVAVPPSLYCDKVRIVEVVGVGIRAREQSQLGHRKLKKATLIEGNYR